MNRYIQRNDLTQPYQQNDCKSPMLAEKCIYMHVFRKNKVKMILWYAIIVVLGTLLVMAEDAYVYDTCTRYGFDIDYPGDSCADTYTCLSF